MSSSNHDCFAWPRSRSFSASDDLIEEKKRVRLFLFLVLSYLVLLAIVAAVNYVLLVVCSLCLLFRQFVAAAHAGDGSRGKL